MSERTINGKPIQKVVEELKAPFADAEIKENPAGYAYLAYELFRQRLDTVVGMNYDYVISQVAWVTIGEKTHISCVGTLSIRDDNGNIVTVKSATGGADVITRSSDGVAVKPGNDAKTADHDAFKSCCRMLGIADEQLRARRKGKKSNGGTTGQTSNSTQSGVQEEKIRVVVMGAFSSLAGGKGYKAPAVIKETGEKVSLVLWKEGMEAVKKYMTLGEFFDKYKSKEFSIVATRNTFTPRNGTKEEQLIMLRPVA